MRKYPSRSTFISIPDISVGNTILGIDKSPDLRGERKRGEDKSNHYCNVQNLM